jgi:hypothetical protein
MSEQERQEIDRRRNQRPGNCDKCRAEVPAQAGYLFKMRGANSNAKSHDARLRGEWVVRCEPCTLKTPSVRRELGLTGEQPKPLAAYRDRRRRLQAAVDGLIAQYADGTGVVAEGWLEAYRAELEILRANFR